MGLVVTLLFWGVGCGTGEPRGANDATTQDGTTAQVCGNGLVEGEEVCDGTALGGQNCATAVAGSEGILRCSADCRLDTTLCFSCGNGVVERAEECDGTSFGGLTCLEAAGETQGELGCSADCLLDTSGCHTCGDGVRTGPEICDGADLPAETCLDHGFLTPGMLSCTSGCTLSLSGCDAFCGNAVIETNELCDATEIGAATCQDVGFVEPGTPQCAPGCQSIDYGVCAGTCGNGILEPDESCDGADLGGLTCLSLGYSEGTLSCAPDCSPDDSACGGSVVYLHATFDGGLPSAWTLSGCWEWGVPTVVGPSSCLQGECLGMDLDADYPNSIDWGTAAVTTPPFTLPPGSQPVLVFHSWLNAEGATYDGANVKVSTDGVLFTTLLDVDPGYNLPAIGPVAQPGWGGVDEPWFEQWHPIQVDLAAYAGQTIWLRFDFYSDASVPRPGWYIDDVLVTDAQFTPVSHDGSPSLWRAFPDRPYQAQLTATGGSATYQWTITGGVNHGWLTLDPQTGLVTGVPLTGNTGPVQVDVVVADGVNPQNAASRTYDLEVVAPTGLPFTAGFEGSGPPVEWIAAGDWQWGTPTFYGPVGCFEGTACFGTVIDGPYSGDQDFATCVLDSPPLDLTSAAQPVLSFFHWREIISTDFGSSSGNVPDGGNVKISSDGGQTWSVLTPPGGYDEVAQGEPVYNGDHSTTGWQRVTLDLSSYVGEVVLVRWAFASDGSISVDGWYVDAVMVTEATALPVFIHTPSDLGSALVGQPFSRTLQADGGDELTWTLQPGGTNDGWLTIDPTTGVVDGTPLVTHLGPVSATIRAAANGLPSNFDEQTFTLTVYEGVWQQTLDSTPVGWSLAGGWEWGVPTNVGPVGSPQGSCLGIDLDAHYADNLSWTGCTATSEPIDLTTATAPLLVFRSWLLAEGGSYDGANLKISTDGVLFTPLVTVNPAYNLTVDGEPAWGGPNELWAGAWTSVDADLAAYAGQVVYLRFAFRSDSSVQFAGWYIDELMVID